METANGKLGMTGKLKVKEIMDNARNARSLSAARDYLEQAYSYMKKVWSRNGHMYEAKFI